MILINGRPIMGRSAHRRTLMHSKGNKMCYLTDAGDKIYHNPDDGAVALAMKLLKTIKEK